MKIKQLKLKLFIQYQEWFTFNKKYESIIDKYAFVQKLEKAIKKVRK